MAITRALVRRRLGDDPSYCHAPSWYGLDLLDTQLVNFSNPRSPNQPLTTSQTDWTWKTPQSIVFRTYTHSVLSGQLNEAPQIMLVQKRPGDLVRWETEAFKPALALAWSIKRFLDEFMPVASNQNLIGWKVPIRDSKDNRSVVTLAVTKKGSSGWQIKVGEVEAILSLWMANLEVTKVARTKYKEQADWQRSKSGVALGVDWCRILGPSDQRGVLERDIKCHKLLVQHSTADLATIAAQQLLASFLWTIVDLNSAGYRNTTSLHHALIERNHDVLKLLLHDPRIMRGLGATECDGLNLLEFAFERSDQTCLTTLLLHRHSKSTVFFMGGCKTIIPKHANLDGNVKPWDEWERGILDPKRKVLCPIHKLAEAGRQERTESLLHHGMNVHERDEGSRTPADNAARYHHKELKDLRRKDNPDRDLTIHKYSQLCTFINVYHGPEHVNVPPTAEGMGSYVRKNEAITPNSKRFYYEIEALHLNTVSLASVRPFVPQRSLPGWHEGSWAYHGDDGGLYVEDRWPASRESDQTFDVDDVVGCGMDFETGKGYRTKNGVFLDSGIVSKGF
ncbi:serine threonine phosphatase 6 regulatory ankyrin repeat subunit A [Fusarium sp. NRRL 52700]|nr:serine threonine phosphatase 6 regulatory ankyrin repeat subunit A [Fusarium sp. NRRL 52700]